MRIRLGLFGIEKESSKIRYYFSLDSSNKIRTPCTIPLSMELKNRIVLYKKL